MFSFIRDSYLPGKHISDHLNNPNRGNISSDYYKGKDVGPEYEVKKKNLGFGGNIYVKQKKSPTELLRQEMLGEAKSFREGLGDLQGRRAGLLADQAREALDTGLTGIREGYNRRGLLYSGLRQGAETGLAGGISGQLRRSIAESNKELEDTALAKERAAASVGLAYYGQQLEANARREEMRMQNDIMRARAFGEIAQSAGYAAGSAYGGSQEKPAPTYGSTPTYASTNYQMPQLGSQYSSSGYGGYLR